MTLDKHSYSKLREDETVINPVGGVMEQFIYIMSINTDFNTSRDTQTGQVPIKTCLIHIFEEKEILNNSRKNVDKILELSRKIDPSMNENESEKLLEKSRNNLDGFIKLLKEIDACTDHEELKKLVEREIDPSMSKNESEKLLEKSRNNLDGFIKLLKEIDACTDHEELKKLVER